MMKPPLPTTAEQWQELVAKIIHNEIVVDLDRVGGVEHFLANLLEEAESRVEAKLACVRGLELFFEYEQFAVTEPLALSLMLDIAAAFRPHNALPGLLSFLRHHISHDVGLQLGVAHTDLRLRALQALEAYFPAPPLGSVLAYDAYCETLRQYAGITPYTGYAVARLLELRAIGLRDPLITAAVRRADSTALADLVSRILAFNDDRSISDKLGELYTVARSLHQLKAFQEAVERTQAQLHGPTSTPTIRMAEREIPLHFTAESQARVIDDVDFASGLRGLVGDLPGSADRREQ